jgi:hypothetical protein
MARKVRKAFFCIYWVRNLRGCSSLQNASISIAHALMRCMGWRRCESPEPADEAGGEKPQLNAGSFVLQGGGRGQLTKTSQKFTESSI